MRRLCVFCGSNPGVRPAYLAAARELGSALVDRGYGLVYGGASIGLMGAIADTVLERGGEVIGVMPETLVAREVAHKDLTELHVVKTMHERKALMAEKSHGFIAMPGGFGTFEELFEVITWAQLGIHQKPIGLLDIAGYYKALNAMVDLGIEEGFIPAIHRDLILLDETPLGLIARIEAYRPIDLGKKWAQKSDI